jgi:hypothetical protein
MIAALLLLIAAAVEFGFGIDAEGKSLESIADPCGRELRGRDGFRRARAGTVQEPAALQYRPPAWDLSRISLRLF